MGFSRKELRANILSTTRQDQNQIGGLVDEYINMALSEINSPGWAFPRKENFHHMWSFLKQKENFSTVASTEDYILAREIDHINLVRQTESPTLLHRVTDEDFFKYVPDPTATGNPRFYRIWEVEGVSTKLSSADTIDVLSSSASDAGDSALSVSVSGYSSGLWRTNTYQLNGVTPVSGTITFDADSPIIVSKQKNTTGVITARKNTGSTTLVTLSPTERSPRFKVISLYPIPSSVMTIYIEFHSSIPSLYADSDSPILPEKWHYVIHLGTLAKVYQYLNKEASFLSVQATYAAAVRAMVSSDKTEPDLIEHLSGSDVFPFIWQKRTEDVIV